MAKIEILTFSDGRDFVYKDVDILEDPPLLRKGQKTFTLQRSQHGSSPR